MGGAALRGGGRIDPQILTLLGRHAAAGTPCVLATVVRCDPPTSAHPGDAAVIDGDGRLTGWIGGSCSEPLVRREALHAIADGQPRLVRIVPSAEVAEVRSAGELMVSTTCPSGGALEIFVDPHLPRPLLLVVGGSPAARALTALAARSGFRVCAAHPGAVAGDFPDADLVLGGLDLAAAGLGPGAHAVVATMGHYDEDALEAVLAHPAVDVALVASVRRAAAVLENLRRRGLDDAALRRVRTPAGGLRAGRQEEIALLALAEVVALRLERRQLATGAGASTPAVAPDATASLGGFATDPVCGMVVDVAAGGPSAVHDGVTVHFCCTGCRDRFVADPAAFAGAAPA